jgi:hypothetical protein
MKVASLAFAGLAAEADAIYQVIGQAGSAKLVAAQKRAAETREAAKAAAAVLSTESACYEHLRGIAPKAAGQP